MSILIRAAAAYLVLLAAVVAVNFIVTPLYHPGGDGAIQGVGDTQLVHGGGYGDCLGRQLRGKTPCRWRRFGGPEAIPGSERGFLRAVAVFILFFWNWFSSLSPNNQADGQFWAVIDTLMPIVMGVTGCRMFRHSS